ncbi:MAG: 4Fe-4S dicluster domain-containing protein [Ruminococcaceae bacterium]|nr:4Fe-4S dicluster domain-containing protein [Oscillospiraceae bacterium]
MDACIADVDYSINIVENVMPKEYQEKYYPGVPERLYKAKAAGITLCQCDGCLLADEIRSEKHYLEKRVSPEAMRAQLKAKTEKLISIEHGVHEDLKAAAQKWLDTYDDEAANAEATAAYIAEMDACIADVDYSLHIAQDVMPKEYREAHYPGVLERLLAAKEKGITLCQCDGCLLANDIRSRKGYLAKRADAEAVRAELKAKTEKLMQMEHGVHDDLKAVAQQWLDTYDDAAANAEATEAYIAEMDECIAPIDYSINIAENVMTKEYRDEHYPGVYEALLDAKAAGKTICQCGGCLLADEIRSQKAYLAKPGAGGSAKLETMVHTIMEPVNLNYGDDVPVSAFIEHADGTFQQGAAAYEKRGVAVDVPEWQADKCIQCNQCAYVCPHATIRPFALDAADMAGAPGALKHATMKGKDVDQYQFTQAISPLDCMGCGVCAQVCPAPGKALEMKGQESQLPQQEVFDWCVANVSKKDGMMSETSVKGSQFNQPLLEFSGSCAGCAETAYARLVTQLYGERMYISNATGCSSIWGGPAATSPYTISKRNGQGPAWANSLFEDNAENGYGMYLGQKAIRARLKRLTEKMLAADTTPPLREAAQKWLDTFDDGKANETATAAYIAQLQDGVMSVDEGLEYVHSDFAKNKFGERIGKVEDYFKNLKEKGVKNCVCEACATAEQILAEKDYLSKKSVWIFGGDGWAYDIGYGGLDHVLASGEDVNVFVFDTEVYSNTGGQASKASQTGQVAQFAAAGKNIGKKSLAEMAMAYGYVYVAQIAMGADQNQTIKAIAEAESYHGPSLIIGYAPCEMHGIKGGMVNCQSEMKKAVQAGYWFNFRFDPSKKAEGKNPFTLDSKEPTGDYLEFIGNETRYSSLKLSFPDRADKLFSEAADQSKDRYAYLQRLGALYEPK